jgi:sigma-B regulation protein RsbU (phosphoserine phosphatase)
MVKTTTIDSTRDRLETRRAALVDTMREIGDAEDLRRMQGEIDRTLAELDGEHYGECVVCREPFEDDELRAEPMKRYCLCDLSDAQRGALEHDLQLAWSVQASLLPPNDVRAAGWHVHHRYRPAGPVGGDYCDVRTPGECGGWLYFLVGDVVGKGVAASFVMAHLSALVRSTLDADGATPVATLVSRLNRYLAEHGPASRFVTLACGRANAAGDVELCNAGHCPPIVLGESGAESLASSGFPIGVVDESAYETHRLTLDPGAAIVLHTDGITEAQNDDGRQYGAETLRRLVMAHRAASPAPDDVTFMVLRRDV